MVVRRTALLVALLAALGVGLVGAVASAQQQATDEAASGGDSALLARLAELEPSLPDAPAPTGVTLDDSRSEGDDTWGSLQGDLSGQAATLETVRSELTALYADADDTRSEVGAAVADVARGWLDLTEASQQLADWETHDLALPVGTADDDDVATGGDEVRGRAEAGLRLALGARQRHLHGYVALRALAAAEPADQTLLDQRADDAEAFDTGVRPQALRMLSARTTQVAVVTDRFETDAPGSEARARSLTVTCLDREAYAEAARQPQTQDGAPGAPQLDEELGATTERLDCPDLPGETTP